VTAHERVHLLVEEVRVTEVERQPLVAAAIHVRVCRTAPAYGERIERHAVEHDREPDALRFAQTPCLGEHLHRGMAHATGTAALMTSRMASTSFFTPSSIWARSRPV